MKMFSVALPLLPAVLLVLAGGVQAYGSSIPYTDPAGQGTQSWGGNLALTFNVNSDINVDALGVFNASGTGYIASPIEVAIYDITTNSIVAIATFSGQYTPQGLGYDVFQSIPVVTLAPGSYEVDAFGFGPADLNGNLNTGSSSGPILDDLGGALTFTGAAWDSDTASLDFPTTCPSCQSIPLQDVQFDAGTFATTPEPGSLLLLGTGLLGLAAILFRKAKSSGLVLHS